MIQLGAAPNCIFCHSGDIGPVEDEFNYHYSLDDKCHRFLNAVEPGTQVPIHRHPTKDETFVLLRGRVRVTTHNDDGSVKDCIVLCPEEGVYGVNIPKGVWHTLESLESSSVFFE